MKDLPDIETFEPIRGLHICRNRTGSYVKKTDYESLEEENKKLERYNLQLKVAAQEALLKLPIELLRNMDEGFIGHLKGEDPKPSTGILGTNHEDKL